MKFYKDKTFYYWALILINKSNAIINHKSEIRFFKNGLEHNFKNAALSYGFCKHFFLNGKNYGDQYEFTKESWRKFVKLQVFL